MLLLKFGLVLILRLGFLAKFWLNEVLPPVDPPPFFSELLVLLTEFYALMFSMID